MFLFRVFVFFLCFLFSLNPGESISYIKDQGCVRSAEGVGASRMASLPPPLTPKRGAEGVGPMVCPICEPTEHDVIDLIGMGKLRKTISGRDIACLCKSKVTPLGAKSVSFLDLANLHRATSQPDLPPPRLRRRTSTAQRRVTLMTRWAMIQRRRPTLI